MFQKLRKNCKILFKMAAIISFCKKKIEGYSDLLEKNQISKKKPKISSANTEAGNGPSRHPRKAKIYTFTLPFGEKYEMVYHIVDYTFQLVPKFSQKTSYAALLRHYTLTGNF